VFIFKTRDHDHEARTDHVEGKLKKNKEKILIKKISRLETKKKIVYKKSMKKIFESTHVKLLASRP
jgi:hypothetical protein